MEVSELFPFSISTRAGQGEEIQLAAGEPFSSFWREYGEWFRYDAYLDQPIGTPLLAITGTKLCVGCVATMGKGLVLFLPQLNYDEDEDEGANDSEDEQDEGFFNALIDLVEALKGDVGEFALPEWSGDYLLPTEKDMLGELDKLDAEASRLLNLVDERKRDLLILQQRKILFTGTGEALRLMAGQAFAALGFQVSDGAPGRTDLVLSSKEGVAVAEVKGLGKSAREKDAAQLEKWVSEYQLEHDVTPKGVLVVNAFSSKALSERVEASYPDQMLPYSVARGHCLMTGLQLLMAWLECEKDGRRRAGIRKSILACAGRYDRYADWTGFSAHQAESRLVEVEDTV